MVGGAVVGAEETVGGAVEGWLGAGEHTESELAAGGEEAAVGGGGAPGAAMRAEDRGDGDPSEAHGTT